LLQQDTAFTVPQIKAAIDKLEKQMNGIDDTHRFLILYEMISSALRFGKTSLSMINKEFGSI